MNSDKKPDLVPFSLAIKGLVSAEVAQKFYERVSEIASTIGDLSTAQTVIIGFNIPAITAEEKRNRHLLDKDEQGLVLRDLASEELQATLVRLGEVVKSRRCELGLSQSVLAGMAGISQAYISEIERAQGKKGEGPKVPIPEGVVGLARTLGIDERHLLWMAGYEIAQPQVDRLDD